MTYFSYIQESLANDTINIAYRETPSIYRSCYTGENIIDMYSIDCEQFESYGECITIEIVAMPHGYTVMIYSHLWDKILYETYEYHRTIWQAVRAAIRYAKDNL